jgi:hypothetical protein
MAKRLHLVESLAQRGFPASLRESAKVGKDRYFPWPDFFSSNPYQTGERAVIEDIAGAGSRSHKNGTG